MNGCIFYICYFQHVLRIYCYRPTKLGYTVKKQLQDG